MTEHLTKKIYPLILCGGSGTRLWPISRTRSPKQFQRVGGKDTLPFFQSAIKRHEGDAFHAPVIVGFGALGHCAVLKRQADG